MVPLSGILAEQFAIKWVSDYITPTVVLYLQQLSPQMGAQYDNNYYISLFVNNAMCTLIKHFLTLN